MEETTLLGATLRVVSQRSSDRLSSLVAATTLLGPAGSMHYGAIYGHSLPEAEKRALSLDDLGEHETLADRILEMDPDSMESYLQKLHETINLESNIISKEMLENFTAFEDDVLRQFAVYPDLWNHGDTAMFIMISHMFTNPGVALFMHFKNKMSSATARMFNNMFPDLERKYGNSPLALLYLDTVQAI